MPTSSERLKARANAYFEAATSLDILVDRTDSELEAEEFARIAGKLWNEHLRLEALVETREEKEQTLEHRRKTT